MKTVILMRHAKSAWPASGDDPRQKDIDRPLAPRGRKAAPEMGAWLAEQGAPPELVLCSTAQRARETYELARTSLPKSTAVRYEPGLYMATPRDLLNQIIAAPAEVSQLMLVGHNPGLGELAITLAGSGDMKALSRLHAKFPTGAIAIFDFKIDKWADIAPGKGKLRAYLRPRDRE